MSLGSRVVKNVMSQYGMRLLTLGIGFAMIPFLTRKLGAEAFGVIILFESLVQVSEASLGGFRSALSRYATVAWSQGRTDDFERYLTTGRMLLGSVALAVLVLGLGIWFALALPPWLKVPEPLRDPARMLFGLFSLSFAISMPNAAYRAGLYAKERFDRLNAALSTAIVFRAILIWVLFSWSPAGWSGLALYGLAHLAVSIVRTAAIQLEFDRQFPLTRKRMRGFDAATAREIFSFGTFSFLLHTVSSLHEGLIYFMVNGLLGPAAGGLFGVGSKIPDTLYSTLKEPAWALEPTATALAAKKETEKLHSIVFLYTKASVSFIVPLCLLLALFARDILRLWAGETYAAAAPVMIWSLAGLFFTLPFAVCDALPPAYGRVRGPAILGSLGCVVSAGLAYVLAAVAGWGLAGFAAGVAIVWAFYAVFYTVPLACRLAGISLRKYFSTGFLKPVAAAFLFVGAYAWVLSATRGLSLSWAAAAMALPFAAAYAACAWLWVFERRERDGLLGFVRKKR